MRPNGTGGRFILPTEYELIQLLVQPLAKVYVRHQANADGNIPTFLDEWPRRSFRLRLCVHGGLSFLSLVRHAPFWKVQQHFSYQSAHPRACPAFRELDLVRLSLSTYNPHCQSQSAERAQAAKLAEPCVVESRIGVCVAWRTTFGGEMESPVAALQHTNARSCFSRAHRRHDWWQGTFSAGLARLRFP